MKTAQELLDQAPSRIDQQAEYQHYLDYNEEGELPENLILVYHVYASGNYEGTAYGFGFDTEKNMWFEVGGSHCSCFGLEGQWEPDYSTFDQLVEAIKRTIDAYVTNDYSSSEPYNDQELQEFVGYFGPKA